MPRSDKGSAGKLETFAVSTSSISSTLTINNALISKLAAASAANAQSMANYRLQLIGNDLTAQLNKKIAALQAQAEDPNIPVYQQQEQQLTQQQTTYQNAEAALSENGTALSQISLQLGNLAVAAQAGDSTSFDQALASAQNDVSLLQTVPFAPGLQPDGVAGIQYNGLGIQSSASYDLSTPAGQAQALSDIQAAQNAVQASSSTTSLNQQITASVQQALQTQISGISTQISNLQNSELSAASATIANLQQQTQEEYHIIQLDVGDETNATSILTSVQTLANESAVQPGTTMSILVGNNGVPTLFSANLPTPTSGSSSTAGSGSSGTSGSGSSASGSSGSSAGNGSTGQIISTSA